MILQITGNGKEFELLMKKYNKVNVHNIAVLVKDKIQSNFDNSINENDTPMKPLSIPGRPFPTITIITRTGSML